jgi:hypothetical protein
VGKRGAWSPRLFIVTLSWLFISAGLFAQPSRYLIDSGPLRIRDQFLPSIGFLSFDPLPADVLEKDHWQLDLVVTVANDFAHSEAVEQFLAGRSSRQPLTLDELRSIEPAEGSAGIYHLDGEHYRTAIAIRRGVGRGLQMGVLIPFISYQGGVLDGAVEDFHDGFSLSQAGRLGVARNAFTAYVRSGEREVFIQGDPSSSLSDIVLTAKGRLLGARQGTRTRLALQGSLKLPTGDAKTLTGSGSTDLGIELLGTRYYGSSCLHVSVGAARLGAHDLFDIPPQTLLSGMLAWERALGKSMTGLVQLTISESPFSDLDLENLNTLSSQITLGVKKAIGANVFFFGLTENVVNFDNSPDIGVHLGLTRTFGSRLSSSSLIS